MARIVVSGYYGFGNAGDEALLEAMIAQLRALRPGVEIEVLSADPARTERAHGVRAVPRMQPLSVLSALARADLLVSGGGTLLQDASSVRSILYYSAIFLLAKILGKRAMLYANGVGPVYTGLGRWLSRQVVRRADAITLRDERSRRDLLEIIDPPRPVEVTADPALVLEPAGRDVARRILAAEGIPLERPLVGLSVRPWRTDRPFLAEIAAACDRLAGEFGLTIVFLPLQHPPDLEASLAAMAAMKSPAYAVRRPLAARELMAVLGECRLVIGMRLHSLILAAAQAVPQVGIIYDPKVEGFLASCGQASAGRVDDLSGEALARVAEEVLAGHQQYAGRLRDCLPELRRLAGRNAEIALGLLKAR